MLYLPCRNLASTVLLLAFTLAADATPHKAVYKFHENFRESIRLRPEMTEAGIARTPLLQAPALLQIPAVARENAVTYRVALPPCREGEKLALAFAYGFTQEQGKSAGGVAWFTVTVNGNDSLRIQGGGQAWVSRAVDLTDVAATTATATISFSTTSASGTPGTRACWIDPQIIRHTSANGTGFLPGHNFLVCDVASIEFGKRDKNDRLTRNDNPSEGVSSYEMIEGESYAIPGRANPTSPRFFYVDVDDGFSSRGDWCNFALAVDFFDETRGDLHLEYDSFDPEVRKVADVPGSFKFGSNRIYLQGTNRRRSHIFLFQDGWFDGGCNGRDFRFNSVRNYPLRGARLYKVYPPFQPSDAVRSLTRFKPR